MEIENWTINSRSISVDSEYFPRVNDFAFPAVAFYFQSWGRGEPANAA